MKLRLITNLILLLTLIPADWAVAADCSWSGVFEDNAPNTVVHALVVHDDGRGEALFVGGGFTSIAGETHNYIARWDGSVWSNVGAGLGLDVYALAVFDDGSGPALYAGGRFPTAGAAPASNIAKWDGAQWSALGSGTDGDVLALAVHDDGTGPALYAGGRFVTAGGVSGVGAVARWDGTSWSALGSGVNNQVHALASVDNGFSTRLYVGGFFTEAGGLPRRNIASWHNGTWLQLNSGTDNGVRAVVAFDDGEQIVPHIGGDFSTANVPVFYVAKYRFTQWLNLAEGLFGRVRALATFDDGDGEGLYAGGEFTRTQADNTPANRIARWNRINWRPLGTGLVGGEVRALAGFGSGLQRSLYAGGWFLTAGGRTSRYMARWSCPDDSRMFHDGFELAN